MTIRTTMLEADDGGPGGSYLEIGFLRANSAGWSLAPAFGINPDPRPGPRELSTRIGLDDPGARVDTLLDVAEAFRLRAPEALRFCARSALPPDAGEASPRTSPPPSAG